jgi:hypothetical protein
MAAGCVIGRFPIVRSSSIGCGDTQIAPETQSLTILDIPCLTLFLALLAFAAAGQPLHHDYLEPVSPAPRAFWS